MYLAAISVVTLLFVNMNHICVYILYVACPIGCSLCNGPQNSDCLACKNPDLYRDTTNVLSGTCGNCGAGTTQNVDVFGVRTCVLGECQ